MKKLHFKIGETVVDPQLGLCQLQGVNQLSLDGKTELYYVLNSRETKVMIPESQVIIRGLRRPVTKKRSI